MIIKPTIDLDNNSNQRVFFMGDLHYNHSNVIRFDSRPFNDVEAMNDYIERELKTKLRPDDILFDLGDLFWKTEQSKMLHLMNQIPAKRIYKILGNHDKPVIYKSMLNQFFIEVGDIFDVNIKYQGELVKVILSHYPILSWQCKSHGSIHLHAHCHGNLDQFNEESQDLRVDIGLNSSLAKSTGSFLVEFRDVCNYFLTKTNGMNFRNYMKSVYNSDNLL